MNNIRDFIVLHYITNRTDTQFWTHLQTAEIPDSLATNLDMWKTRLSIADDFTDCISKNIIPTNIITFWFHTD